MKKTILLSLLSLLFFSACKKNYDDFEFSGTVCGYMQCTLITQPISEQDYGYYVSLDTPDTIGKEYYDPAGVRYENCVLLYRTYDRFKANQKISGRMYLDDSYSKAYCSYHSTMDIPEAVCVSLD